MIRLKKVKNFKRIKDLLEQANKYFFNDDLDNCISLCRDLIHCEFLDIKVEALILLATAYLHKNEFNNALAQAKLAHQYKSSAKTWGTLGAIYTELGLTAEALSHDEEAAKLEPDNYLYCHGIATSLICLNRIDEAITISNKMKTLFDKKYPAKKHYLPQHNPMLIEHYRGLGLAYLIKKKFDESLKNIEKALEIDPNDLRSLLVKGYLLLHGRSTQDAIECFKRCYELERTVQLGITMEIYRGLGFSHLYSQNFKEAIICLKLAFDKHQDLTIATGLFDAYCSLEQYEKADKLIKNCGITGLENTTTKSPALFNPIRPKSYVVVYIWNPVSNKDYGHAAIKVVHEKKSFYFSWFPSGENYMNKQGFPRATPSSYGKKLQIENENQANERLQLLYHGKLPENSPSQIKQLLMRKSDKAELRKNATFKIYFYKGIDIERLLDWWKTLLASDKEYDERSYNCCDVVLHSLQYALDKTIKGTDSINTAKMRKNKRQSSQSPLTSHLYEISPQSGSKSTTIYQYTYLLATHINKYYDPESSNVPMVTIRYNRWNKALKKITKFDFDPEKFNPNWLTKHTKICKRDIYLNLINQFFSEVLFKRIDSIDFNSIKKSDFDEKEQNEIFTLEFLQQQMNLLNKFENKKKVENSTQYNQYTEIEKQKEEIAQKLYTVAQQKGYECEDVPDDNNCQFHAISSQLKLHKNSIMSSNLTHEKLREIATDFINKKRDIFKDTIEDNIDNYINKMKQVDKEWGDFFTLIALSQALNINISVLHIDGNTISIPDPPKANSITINIGYNGFTHYCSLKPKRSSNPQPSTDTASNDSRAQVSSKPSEKKASSAKNIPPDSPLSAGSKPTLIPQGDKKHPSPKLSQSSPR